MVGDRIERFRVLEQQVRRVREYGAVRAGAREVQRPHPTYFPQSSEIALINEYLTAEGFDVPERWWDFLNAIMAAETLAGVIHKDLAYSAAMGDETECHELAQRFVCLFDPKAAVFLSNGVLYDQVKYGNSGSGWNPLTSATFDGGVVGFDGTFIAYFWFEDED